MKVIRFLLGGFLLSEFVGLNCNATDDIADKILDAKKRVGELEVQHTKLALQLAQEGQHLKQIANNAMLDTQNFITSEKDKEEQLKNAITKINALEKQQADLVEQVKKLNKTISDTREQQRKMQKQELQQKRISRLDEPLIQNAEPDFSAAVETRDKSLKNIKPKMAKAIEDLDELSHISIEESNGTSSKKDFIKTDTVSQKKQFSRDKAGKDSERTTASIKEDHHLDERDLKDLEEKDTKDSERTTASIKEDHHLDERDLKDLEEKDTKDGERAGASIKEDHHLDERDLKDLEEKDTKDGERSEDESTSKGEADTEKTSSEADTANSAEDTSQENASLAEEDELQTSTESTAEANKTIDEAEKAIEESEKKVDAANSSKATLKDE